MRDMVDYWRTQFDWRAQEDRLKELPQYTTTLDGARVHVIHVRSPEPGALPLILTHGWPGPVAEFLNVIGSLAESSLELGVQPGVLARGYAQVRGGAGASRGGRNGASR